MDKSDSDNEQLRKDMSNIWTTISTRLHNVSAELQESITLVMEPFVEKRKQLFQEEIKEDLENIMDTILTLLHATGAEREEAMAPFIAPGGQKTKAKDEKLQPLPQTALLAENRREHVKKLNELEDINTIKNQQREISNLVTSLLSGRIITNDVLKALLETMDRGIPKPKLSAVMFFSEALKHRGLLKKNHQETAMQLLLRIIKEEDGSLCRIAMEAVRNAITGAPGLIKSNTELIHSVLKSRLSKTTDGRVIYMALRVMSSIILLLRKKVPIHQYISACRDYMGYANENVQIATITLLKDLTVTCRAPLYGRYGKEVKSMIPAVLLKMNSTDNISMRLLSAQTLQSCQEYIQGNHITGLLRTQAVPMNNETESHYYCLAYNHPKLIKKVLLQTPDYLRNSADKEAVVTHVGFLKDVINEDHVTYKDICHLSQALASLLNEEQPLEVRKATREAITILATRWPQIRILNK